MILPKDWELIGVFEAEPSILDPRVPWAYNKLTFETTRGDDKIRCEIEPGYDQFKLVWWRNSFEIVNVDLRRVIGLSVCMKDGNESISLKFDSISVGPLILQLKPTVRLTFATHNPL
ncbi:MAG: hypothetical protein K8T25_00175 [Planctomycetia bacterium]|nr:hypothetical protein [Planctomycetia bacterium]